MTSVVLLRKSYQRKRRFNLHASETTSLAVAIRNLLYNSQQLNGEEADRPYGKDPLPNILSTLPSDPANRQQTQPKREGV